MVPSISAFDARILVQEAKALEGSCLQKVQQIGPELFKFSFSGKRELLVEPGRRFNLTSYRLPAPARASQVSMLLRKHLEGRTLRDVSQYRFDRVVTLDFGDRKLVLEFFSHGNMVLADADFRIIFAFRQEEWRDRCVKKGAGYSYPQGGLDPAAVSPEDFSQIFTGKDIVRSLVRAMGFGGVYAEEICRLAGVEKGREKPDPAEVRGLYEAMRSLLRKKPEPVLQNGTVYPFPLSGIQVEKRYPTMSEAIDDLYLPKEKPANQRLEKLRRRLAEQEKALGEFERRADEEKRKGDLVYSHFKEIEKELRIKKGKIQMDLD